MTTPTFGLTIQTIDNEIRPAVWGDLSVIGLVGTAPAANAAAFPLDTPVLVNSSDAVAIAALGNTGTLADALRLITAQLGEFQSAARCVVVRVAEGADINATLASVAGDGISTGVAALLEAGPLTGYTPRLLAAPGFTSQHDPDEANVVVAALAAVAPRLLAHAVVDGPTSTAAAAQAWRETINSDRIIPVVPGARVLDAASATGAIIDAPMAAAILGIGVRRDFEFGGRPFHSWANQPVMGIVGTTRPVPFSLTDGTSEGQSLLAANIGIVTRGEMGVDGGIANGGFVYIGTDNAGDDDLWRFYNVMRGRDYIHLMALKTLRTYLGRFNITGQTIQAVLNTINLALRDLQSTGDILGYKVQFLEDQNSPEDLRAGKISVQFLAEEAPVLRRIDIQSGRYRAALESLIGDLATA